jgi:hypothetical protein
MSTRVTAASFLALSLAAAAPAAAQTGVTQDTTTVTESGPAAQDGTEIQSQTQIERVRVGTSSAPQLEPTAPDATAPGIERTTITERRAPEGGLREEAVGIKPQFGFLTVEDAFGETNTRGVVGMTIDANLLKRARTEGGKPFLGPSFGVLYSHLGRPGADFFGNNAPSGTGRGTHLILLPLNLKAGYTFSDAIRLAVHGGMTALYTNTSSEDGVAVGLDPSTDSWSTRGNLGLDVELGIGRNVSLLLRPDWTFGELSTVFSGTLGLGFPIS